MAGVAMGTADGGDAPLQSRLGEPAGAVDEVEAGCIYLCRKSLPPLCRTPLGKILPVGRVGATGIFRQGAGAEGLHLLAQGLFDGKDRVRMPYKRPLGIR